MSSFRFHGLTDVATADAIDAELVQLQPGGLRCVRHQGLAAIVSPAPRVFAFLTSRRALALDLVAFQQVLESLMRYGPIVPAAYQATFPTEPAITDFLAGNCASLGKILGEFGDKRQFQITIGWKPEAMLRRLNADGSLATSIEVLQRDGLSRGPAIQHHMQRHRTDLSQTFEALLRSASLDCLILPGADADTLLNATLLLSSDGESRLDDVVAQIDATASEALVIKMAGPLPACGFASLGVEVPGSGDVARACRSLGVARFATLAELKSAYHARMRLTHPDVAAADTLPDTDCRAAYDLLIRVRSAELALDRPGPAPRSEVPLLQMIRADFGPIAA